MTVPFWVEEQIASASFWDFLLLGGVTWPGIWTIEADKSRAIDPAKEKGQDGITLTDNGYDASLVKAIGLIWKPTQLEALEEILPNFDPRRPGGSRTPLDIYHPVCTLLAIKTVYLRKISLANPQGGILRVNLDMIEWFPKTKPASTSKKAKGFDGTDKSGAPLNANDFTVTKPSSNTAGKL